MAEEPKTPPEAAADKPAGTTPGEPIKGEVSRTVPAKPLGAEAAKAAPTAKAPHVPPPPPPPAGPTDPPPPADKAVPGFITSLQAQVADGVSKISFYLGDWTIIVPAAKLIEVARHLRDSADSRFDYLSDLTATDWPPRKEGRFDVLYMLYSTVHRHRVRVKVIVAENQPLASATAVWPAANWLEREVYDLFGVNFTGHPDRRRILMPDDWQGFPQRKDYPLEGPGELLMENPIDWLKLRQAKEEAEIE